jgi:hypothetical protein
MGAALLGNAAFRWGRTLGPRADMMHYLLTQ